MHSEKKITFAFFLNTIVASVPSGSWNGGYAVPTHHGAILHNGKNFYKLTCDTSACSWATMPYEASVSRNHGVLMWLPPSFTPSCSGMLQAEGQGGQLPPNILADQKAPHYYLPPPDYF